jgi:SAM-dependent methyltransferase
MPSTSLNLSTRDHFLRQTTEPYVTFALLYDALLGDRFFPEIRRAFERLVQGYGIRFTSAADIACGTGTFVRYLREGGVPVVYGADRSAEMLREAVRKNQDYEIRFLLQDFFTLQLPQRVDLITCNFDSLNYLLTTGGLLRALQRFHANLKPGGHLMFDMITDRPRGQGSRSRVEHATWPGVMVVRATRWDPRRSIQTAVVSIVRNDYAHREIHLQRRYPVSMVVGLLAQARFTLMGAHDFHTLAPATNLTQRSIYVARVNNHTKSAPL